MEGDETVDFLRFLLLPWNRGFSSWCFHGQYGRCTVCAGNPLSKTRESCCVTHEQWRHP